MSDTEAKSEDRDKSGKTAEEDPTRRERDDSQRKRKTRFRFEDWASI